MSRRELHFVVPGPLDQPTGGYRYDARMVDGLREAGWRVTVHNLDGTFPADGDDRARESLETALGGVPEGGTVVADGLAVGALPGPVRGHAERLRLLALVHHPLADETGLEAARSRRLGELEREALAACRGVVVTSGFTAERLDAFGVERDRIRVVRPGTEPHGAAVGPGPDHPPALLCVASVIPRKGYDVLVAALAGLRDEPWSCVCAGPLDRASAYAEAVQDQARAAGLAERIRFAGACSEEELDRLYHTSSIFVLPSHYEGYGMALTEALSRGLPVVSTTGGAIPYTVPADAGILVPPGDAGALERGLAAVVGDSREVRSRRSALSSAARRHAASLPSWEEAARAFGRAVLELAT